MLLKDHDVKVYGEHLKGKRIAFVVTGGIAAFTAPKVIRALRTYSCEVFPYATEEALKFVTEDTLAWAAKNDVVTKLTSKSEHLGQDNQSFDAVIVYPATYNFIGKMAGGLADDACSSLIASHLSCAKIIYFPTMHINMWNSPVLEDNIEYLNRLRVVKMMQPRFENDKANVADTRTTVVQIVRELSTSALKGERILVTAGPTPVKIDNVRMITNKFTGKLGIEIANELYLRGADVLLLQSYTGIRPPTYLNSILHKDYDEYKNNCLTYCDTHNWGIFSAAVADYKPKEVVEGKIPSHGAINKIDLVETEKVIDLVSVKSPSLKMITFKYEEGKTLNELVCIANKRLKLGHMAVVVNDIKLNSDKQKCFYVTRSKEIEAGYVRENAEGKINIARMLANQIEMNVKFNNISN